jgi:hypothetical protein
MWKKILFAVVIGISVPEAEGQNIPQPEAPKEADVLRENLVAFQGAWAEIRREGDRWYLWSGHQRLKDLGPHESEAREVLRLVRYFHLNQWGTVGRPLPIMEYWLSDGRAPQKMGAAVRSVPFDAESLRVDDYQGQYLLRDAKQTLFAFGSQDDAKQALAVIRKYGFTEIAYVGNGVPVMIVWVAGPDKSSRLPGASLVIGSPGKAPGNEAYQKALAAAAQLHPRQLNDASSSLTPQHADERVFFDWRQAAVRFEHGEWKVIAGSLTLANFGPVEQDARDALRVMQQFRLTDRCSVGRPAPAFTYFLANGQPVRTLFFGMETVSFRPEDLTVARVGSNWAIVDGERHLLNCGTHEEDARQALKILQELRIDHLVQVGTRKPAAMTILVRSR